MKGTYEERVQGLRDLTIDCRLKRLEVKRRAEEAAQAKKDAEDHMGNLTVTRNGGGAGANANPMSQPMVFATQPPTMSASIGNNTISIQSPDQLDSTVIEVNDFPIMEAWDTKEAMVARPVGTLGFAAGIAYIMTRGGWVNMGEALEKPLEMTDRRGAIRAQKARKGTRS